MSMSYPHPILSSYCRFGLSPGNCKVSVDQLQSWSLPTPALALLEPGALQDNFKLLDQRFPIAEGQTKRSLGVNMNEAYGYIYIYIYRYIYIYIHIYTQCIVIYIYIVGVFAISCCRMLWEQLHFVKNLYRCSA